jgi:hypothetical protein
MGRLYKASTGGVSISTIADLMFIAAPTDGPVLIHEIAVEQEDGETSEQLPVTLFRTTTDQAAVGTGVTPVPLDVGDAAFGGVVRRTITGGSLSTETTVFDRRAFNILNGFFWTAKPGQEIVLSPVAGTGGRFVVKLATAPSAALIICASVLLEELGG